MVDRDDIFVSPQWLHERLSHPDLLAIDGSWYLPTMLVDGQPRDATAEYAARHIPGAVFFDLDAISDQHSDLPHMMPDAVSFSSAMRQLGIGDGMTLVVYDGAGLFSAPRVWWMLKTMGAQRVFLLDGGLPAWNALGLPVDDIPVRRSPRPFTDRLDASAIADLAHVTDALADPQTVVIDARPGARFEGGAPEPRPGVRSGHMPGARSLPFTDLIADGRLKPKDDIAALLSAHGIAPSDKVVTTCGSGVSAVTVALALSLVGTQDVRVYDGSWAEWGSRHDLPVETGPDRGAP